MRAILFALALLTLATPTLARGGLADVEIYDRNTGLVLPIYERRGRLYVAGEPRHQYEVRIRNRASGRLLAVTSVDGVNVITGDTADQRQSGYVIEPADQTIIDGWRKSMSEVATFYFTELKDSYAARTGRPHDVGVIGVALFREREAPCCRDVQSGSERAAPRSAAPPAAAPQAGAAESDDLRRESNSKLGTGHGHREWSAARYVDFERRSSRPDETIVIYYDSRRNLVAQGVIPARPALADRRPNPFPNGFVPDP